MQSDRRRGRSRKEAVEADGGEWTEGDASKARATDQGTGGTQETLPMLQERKSPPQMQVRPKQPNHFAKSPYYGVGQPR